MPRATGGLQLCHYIILIFITNLVSKILKLMDSQGDLTNQLNDGESHEINWRVNDMLGRVLLSPDEFQTLEGI